MREILIAVGALMRAIAGATKTVAVFCSKTGRWVTKTVVETAMLPLTIWSSGRGEAEAAEAVSNVVPARKTETAPSMTGLMEKVKTLATNLASETARAEVFEGVPDSIIDWLAVMDRQMLCRVACAKAELLAAHIGGKTTLKGVLVYNLTAVAEYKEAMLRTSAPDNNAPEFRKQPRLAA